LSGRGSADLRMLNSIVRAASTLVHRAMSVAWFVRRPKTFGAHAIALTPERRLILVKLRYAPGWRMPGGGRAADESAVDAALRELHEEIGMISHGSVEPVCDLEEQVDFRRDTCSLIIVRDVEFRPKRWSWEVEAVCDAPLDDLPADLAAPARRWLRAVEDRL
jgi:8-oxo-dGTP pyrophosphatase MutT (NUDIX family)